MLKLEKEDFLIHVKFIWIAMSYLFYQSTLVKNAIHTAKSKKTNNTGLTTFQLQVAKMTFIFMYSTKALNREVGSNTYIDIIVPSFF